MRPRAGAGRAGSASPRHGLCAQMPRECSGSPPGDSSGEQSYDASPFWWDRTATSSSTCTCNKKVEQGARRASALRRRGKAARAVSLTPSRCRHGAAGWSGWTGSPGCRRRRPGSTWSRAASSRSPRSQCLAQGSTRAARLCEHAASTRGHDLTPFFLGLGTLAAYARPPRLARRSRRSLTTILDGEMPSTAGELPARTMHTGRTPDEGAACGGAGGAQGEARRGRGRHNHVTMFKVGDLVLAAYCARSGPAPSVGRVAGGRRSAPRDPRPRAKSATRDPRPRATRPPGPARIYPVRPGHTRPDPDICQDWNFIFDCNISECLQLVNISICNIDLRPMFSVKQ